MSDERRYRRWLTCEMRYWAGACCGGTGSETEGVCLEAVGVLSPWPATPSQMFPGQEHSETDFVTNTQTRMQNHSHRSLKLRVVKY